MLRDVVVVVVVVRTRPRAMPLAMITMRKSTHGFRFLLHDVYGTPLGGPLGRRSSAISEYASFKEQRWCSGESPRQCGLDSLQASWCHTWVEFVVGSRLALKVFLWVLRFSSNHKKQHLQIPIRP